MKRILWVVMGLALNHCSHGTLPATVILVRHAEKAKDQGKDPELTPEGQQRALELKRMLKKAGVKAIYATTWRRTQQTVAPLAQETGLKVEVLEADNYAGFAERVRTQHQGQVVAYAGHSNTLNKLIEALGGAPRPELSSKNYDDLYLVIVSAAGTQVLELEFGKDVSPEP